MLRRFLPLAFGLLVVVLLAIFPLPTKADFPPDVTNFVDESVIAQISTPIALEFLPDGRLLVIGQFGKVSLYNPTNNNLQTLYTFPATKICTDGERGLLGLALDPNFATNNYIYINYSFRPNSAINCLRQQTNWLNNNARGRVSRFTFNPTTNVFDSTSEQVILDFIPTTDDSHNAGDIHFGADGLLYISVGDGSCALTDPVGLCGAQNNNAQRLDVLLGKILRINKDGTIPADNSFAATNRRCGNPALTAATWPAPGTDNCAELFAWGLRNPFRFVFKPGTNQFYINDVGENHWEEINEGIKGANYGWNIREGLCQAGTDTNCTTTPPTMTNPIYTYLHNGAGASVVGGAFVPAGIWPPDYDNKFLYGDYEKAAIYVMGSSVTAPEKVFADNIYIPIALTFGPAGSGQALYYTLYNPDNLALSEVRRIRYTGTVNSPPVAAFTVTPAYGSLPLTVTFNASATTDPNPGNTISYNWNFGDGSPVQTVATPLVTHTYSLSGIYTASLTATDNLGATSLPVSKTIYAGYNAPVVTITAPTLTTNYGVEDTITLTGAATWGGGNPLPDSALSWTVLKRHADHFHTYLAPTSGNNIPMNTPDPEDLPATENSWLEIRLTATDPVLNLSTTVTQALLPKKVSVTFNSLPAGATISVNGFNFTTPFTVTSWPKYLLNVVAANQTVDNQALTFLRWSNGNGASQAITTPLDGGVYTATFAVNGCDLQSTTVIKNNDDNSCGTLRYVLNQAAPSATVVLSVTDAISLTAPLIITKPVTLQGVVDCGGTLPVVDGSLISLPNNSFLQLSGGVSLRNLHLRGLQLRLQGGTNFVSCLKVSR